MRLPHAKVTLSAGHVGTRRVIKRNGQITVEPQEAAWPWLNALAEPAEALLRQIGSRLRSRKFAHSLLLIPLLTTAQVARGQAIAPLVPTTLDPVYNRGRNLSVTETVDPDYLPLGVRLGSVVAYPSVGVTAGATTNVYATNNFKRSDAYYFLQPAMRVVTDLPMHQLELLGSASLQRYAHEGLRNQDAFFVSGQGRLDIGSELKITGRSQYSQQSESPYSSDLAADVSVLSQYTVFDQSITGIYDAGRVRVTGKVQHLAYKFNAIMFADGASRDQHDRNRNLDRATGQVEYALSPSVAAFAQVNYEVTEFPFPRLDGGALRDSTAISVLAGWNFDLAGFARGSVGGGYTERDYKTANYDDQGGLIIQARAEFFLSPLTTVSAGAQRTLQNAATSNNGSYVDTRASVTVDHALLRNLILSAEVTVVRNKLLDNNATSKRTVASLAARYQSNRGISIDGEVQYGTGRPGDIPLGVPFSELRGQVTLRFRR